MSVPAGWDNTPAIDETLFTIAELEVWSQRPTGSLVGDPFAIAIVSAASLLVREAGSITWTAANVPARAKLIAILVAKNYFLNPTGLKTESTGPITETRIDDVVHNMTLTDDQKAILAGLAGQSVPGGGSGLWVQPSGSGRVAVDNTVYVTDQSGTDWMLPWADGRDHLYRQFDAGI